MDNEFHFTQEIDSPDGYYKYCLFEKQLFRSTDFLVVKVDSKIDPRKIKINDNGSPAPIEMLSSYERRYDLSSNPKITLVANRFLVFSHGGFDFGLYDVKNDQEIFNRCCPFDDWGSQNIWAEKGTYYKGKIEKDERSDYTIWIKNHISDSIKRYIEISK